MRRFALMMLLLASPVLAESESDPVQLRENTSYSDIIVDTQNRQVALGDVLRGVSRINGYDDQELRDAIPKMLVPLDSSATRWTISAINRVLQPCVQVHDGESALRIRVDRVAARDWTNSRKAAFRHAWNRVDWRDDLPEYGIAPVDPVDESNRDIVVLVHGLNSRPEDVATFVPLVRQAGLVPANFRYPNDQPIDRSARLLAEELSELAQRFPNRNVRLLTHSMGGLVARGAIETTLDPGNVTQLIMVAPPNYGSSLARVATFMDCYEFFTSSHHRRCGVLVESVSDGLGEATADLAPNSVYLDRLNTETRNSGVRYSIVLGTAGPMSEAEITELRHVVRESCDGNRFSRLITSKLNRGLEGLDEVVAGKGDGVVSCKRGRLEGVADVVEFPFSHAGVLGTRSEAARMAHEAILWRLRN